MKLFKYAPAVIGVYLGLIFVASGVTYLFDLVAVPPPEEDTTASHFMAAFVPTGYLGFVKALEVIGGILVVIPRTRNIGLLVLGPIIVNILASTYFVMDAQGLWAIALFVGVPALILLWTSRKEFLGLFRKTRSS